VSTTEWHTVHREEFTVRGRAPSLRAQSLMGNNRKMILRRHTSWNIELHMNSIFVISTNKLQKNIGLCKKKINCIFQKKVKIPFLFLAGRGAACGVSWTEMVSCSNSWEYRCLPKWFAPRWLAAWVPSLEVVQMRAVERTRDLTKFSTFFPTSRMPVRCHGIANSIIDILNILVIYMCAAMWLQLDLIPYNAITTCPQAHNFPTFHTCLHVKM
jgi:hypothetical protein